MSFNNKPSSILLEELKLEDEIKKELSDVIVYFDYQENDDVTELSLITISKNHGERFLFHKCTSKNKIDSLKSMLTYIKSDYKTNRMNYEVIWVKKGEGKRNISWFHGISFIEIMDKFYFMKDPADVIIYEIKLKPMA
jgi:hypothetical protein